MIFKDESHNVMDIVGFDSGSNPIRFEGTKLPSYPGGSQNRSYERLAGGASGNCVDTDDNTADWVFSTVASPLTMSDPKFTC